jgi:hypothetical protein
MKPFRQNNLEIAQFTLICATTVIFELPKIQRNEFKLDSSVSINHQSKMMSGRQTKERKYEKATQFISLKRKAAQGGLSFVEINQTKLFAYFISQDNLHTSQVHH